MKLTCEIFAFAVLAFCFACAPVQSRRTLNRCQLAREMDSLGVSRAELARWACIAERESNYRTWVVGPANTDGSHDHGIFQINDLYWCQPSDGRKSYNGCNVDCDDLRTDNIAKAVKCARLVKNQQGFEAWSTWKYCNGYLPSIDDCFDNFASGLHCVGFK